MLMGENIVKITDLPKAVYRVSAIPIKFRMAFFKDVNISKIIREAQKDPSTFYSFRSFFNYGFHGVSCKK